MHTKCLAARNLRKRIKHIWHICFSFSKSVPIDVFPQGSLGRCTVVFSRCQGGRSLPWQSRHWSRATRKSSGRIFWARLPSWASSLIRTSSAWREWSPNVRTFVSPIFYKQLFLKFNFWCCWGCHLTCVNVCWSLSQTRHDRNRIHGKRCLGQVSSGKCKTQVVDFIHYSFCLFRQFFCFTYVVFPIRITTESLPPSSWWACCEASLPAWSTSLTWAMSTATWLPGTSSLTTPWSAKFLTSACHGCWRTILRGRTPQV